MKTKSLLPPAFLGRAHSLEHLGVAESAWSRADALAIVEALTESNIAVLGGDVLHSSNGALTYSNASWHSDPKAGESWPLFVSRSHKEAIAYVSRYPVGAGQEPVFVVVLADALP